MCIDSQGSCAFPTQVNAASQPADNKLKLEELYDLEQKSLEVQWGIGLDDSSDDSTLTPLDDAPVTR